MYANSSVNSYLYKFSAEGVDFSTVETSVMVSAGFTNGEIEFSVDILPDSSVEGDHSFYISILDNGTFTIGSINQTEVIIVDDDSKLLTTCVCVTLFRASITCILVRDWYIVVMYISKYNFGKHN